MAGKRKTFAQLLREKRGRGDADYDRHRRRHPTLGRAARIRSSARWKAVRDKKIRRSPLCEHCAARGVHEAATQVDHIVGLQADPRLAYTMINLQSLCDGCHAKKSARERRES